jgi:hypothetical protein
MQSRKLAVWMRSGEQKAYDEIEIQFVVAT